MIRKRFKEHFRNLLKNQFRKWLGKKKRHAVSLLYFISDSIALALIRRRSKTEPSSKKNLVFVRVDAIGDFILWTASIHEYLALYPKNEYIWTLVGNEIWTELAKELRIFDVIIPIRVGKFRHFSQIRYRFSVFARLKKISADFVVNPRHSREFLTCDALSRAIPANFKIASEGDDANISEWEKRIGDRFYSKLLPSTIDPPTRPKMELIRSAEFISALGGKKIKAKKPDLRDIASRVRQDLPSTPYFIVLPGAGWKNRQWGFANFERVARELQEKYGWLCLFCGSVDDSIRFSSALKKSPLRSEDRMGKTSLTELTGLIANARAVLTNETGAAHLGAACRVPTVCILGGGHYGRFAPWKIEEDKTCRELSCVIVPMPCFQCNWRCIYELERSSSDPVPCIDKISVEQVLKCVHEVLATSLSEKE